MTSPTRVVIADDHYLVREGTRQLLETNAEVVVVASVGSAPELLDEVGRLSPDAVIVDIRMPPGSGTEGIEAAHQIRKMHPDIGVVILSQYSDASYAFQLFKDGTEGLAYLLKDRVGDVDQILEAIRAVTRGDSVVDPKIVEELITRRNQQSSSPLQSLTAREHDVLREIAKGRSNSAIGETLGISQSSVEKYINMVFTKLNLDPSETAVNRRVMAALTFLRDPTASWSGPRREDPGRQK